MKQKFLITAAILIFYYPCIGQTGENHLQNGYNKLLSGEMEQASEYANMVLEENPENAEGYVLRGIINKRTGYFESAISDFDRACWIFGVIHLIPLIWR